MLINWFINNLKTTTTKKKRQKRWAFWNIYKSTILTSSPFWVTIICSPPSASRVIVCSLYRLKKYNYCRTKNLTKIQPNISNLFLNAYPGIPELLTRTPRPITSCSGCEYGRLECLKKFKRFSIKTAISKYKSIRDAWSQRVKN